MSNRGPHDEASDDEAHSARRRTGSESAFDAAQRLLQGALEEVRSSGQDEASLSAEDADAEVAPPHRRHWGRHRHAEAEDATDDGLWPDRPASTSSGQPTPPTPPAPPTTAATGPSPSTAAIPTARRARRPPPPAEPPASSTADFDDPAETVFQSRTSRAQPRGRRRRPVTTASTTASTAAARDEWIDGFPQPRSLPPQVTEPVAPPAEDSPPADEAPTSGIEDPVSTGSHPATRRRRVVVLAGIAAVVVAVAAVVASVGGGGSTGSVAVPPNPPRLAFATITTPDGVTVDRVWELHGKRGSQFVGTLSFSNPTTSARQISFTEVIPKSLAPSVAAITFDPKPVIVKADPEVRYDLTVPAGSTVTGRYDIEVAPQGAKRTRLEAWARDLPSTPTTTTPTTTASTPTTTASTPTTRTSGTTAPTTPTTSPPTTAPPAPGTVILRVISRGGTGTFDFSGPSGGVSLTTSGSPDGVAQSAMTVAPGLYPWTQAATSGWTVTNLDCTDRDAGPFEQRSTTSGSTATYNVQPGETVTCTWTNRKS